METMATSYISYSSFHGENASRQHMRVSGA